MAFVSQTTIDANGNAETVWRDMTKLPEQQIVSEEAVQSAAAQDETDRQAWRDAVSAAASIADIKAALLGSNTPVRPVVDRGK